MNHKKLNLKAILREVKDYANKMKSKSKDSQDRETFENIENKAQDLIYRTKDLENGEQQSDSTEA